MMFYARNLLDGKLCAEKKDLGTVQDMILDTATWKAYALSVRRAEDPLSLPMLVSLRLLHASEPSAVSLKSMRTAGDVRAGPDLPMSTRVDSQDALPDTGSGSLQYVGLRDLHGFRIEALDGPLGVLDDLVVEVQDKGSFALPVRFLAIDVGERERVLLPPLWAICFDWENRRFVYDVTRSVAKSAPRPACETLPPSEIEERLYAYYGHLSDPPRLVADESSDAQSLPRVSVNSTEGLSLREKTKMEPSPPGASLPG